MPARVWHRVGTRTGLGFFWLLACILLTPLSAIYSKSPQRGCEIRGAESRFLVPSVSCVVTDMERGLTPLGLPWNLLHQDSPTMENEHRCSGKPTDVGITLVCLFFF